MSNLLTIIFVLFCGAIVMVIGTYAFIQALLMLDEMESANATWRDNDESR